MQIISVEGLHAVCESYGKRHAIDLSLIGEQHSGTWVLTFLNTAREVLTEPHAMQILDALQALTQAMTGDSSSIESLFADLTTREPELPPHLR